VSETPKCDAAIAAAEAKYDFEHDALRASPGEGRCPKCRFIKGHDRTCPTLDIDKLRDVVSGLIAEASRHHDQITRAHHQRLAWYGKWMAVKQENNALRKSNRALRAELSGLKMAAAARVAANPPCQYQLPDCHCPRCTGRPGPPPKSFYCDDCGCCAPNCPRCIAEGRLHVCTAKNKENPNEPTP